MTLFHSTIPSYPAPPHFCLIGNGETERAIPLLHVLMTHRTEYLHKEVIKKVCKLIPEMVPSSAVGDFKRDFIKLSPLSTLVYTHSIFLNAYGEKSKNLDYQITIGKVITLRSDAKCLW